MILSPDRCYFLATSILNFSKQFTGRPHGVRQTVRMMDLDAGTVECPQSEPNCQNANWRYPSTFSDSVCESVWELTG
jgi:hypothetical protein